MWAPATRPSARPAAVQTQAPRHTTGGRKRDHLNARRCDAHLRAHLETAICAWLNRTANGPSAAENESNAWPQAPAAGAAPKPPAAGAPKPPAAGVAAPKPPAAGAAPNGVAGVGAAPNAPGVVAAPKAGAAPKGVAGAPNMVRYVSEELHEVGAVSRSQSAATATRRRCTSRQALCGLPTASVACAPSPQLRQQCEAAHRAAA